MATSTKSLRPGRYDRPVARRRRRRRRHRGRGQAPRHPCRHRPQRLTRLVLARAADRSRRRRYTRGVWAGGPGRRARPVRCEIPERRHACAGAGAHGRDRLSGQADAPHVRARRHRRSAVARRLPGAWWVPGARERSHDDGRADRRCSHGFGPARARRRGIPDWHQVEDGARHRGRSEVRRLQRGRRRLGHVRRPHDHGERSVRADRRHDDRGRRRRRHEGVRVHPGRVPAGHPHDAR